MPATIKSYTKERFLEAVGNESDAESLTAELMSDLYLGSFTPLDLKGHLDQRIDVILNRLRKQGKLNR